MPLPWMKMWLEALDDPKLTRMSLAERGAWWGLCQLAKRCEAGGKIIAGGEGLTIDEIADALHIKTTEDRQALESMIKKMENRGSLAWNGSILFVVNLEKRQKIAPSSQPEAVAARVRLYRDRQREKKPGSKIHKLCTTCGWKGLTNETYCPDCAGQGKNVLLKRDYTGGKYGHGIQR